MPLGIPHPLTGMKAPGSINCSKTPGNENRLERNPGGVVIIRKKRVVEQIDSNQACIAKISVQRTKGLSSLLLTGYERLFSRDLL
jgi:hypothetical protein